MPSPTAESSTLSLENPHALTESGRDEPAAALPTIVISQYESQSEPPEEAAAEKEQPSACSSDCSSEGFSQEKIEDSDIPLTTHIKMIIKGLTRSRSQESLVSSKNPSDDEQPRSDRSTQCSQNGVLQGESTEIPSWLHFSARSSKKEKTGFKTSGGSTRAKGKDSFPREEDSQCLKSQVNWEQLEATKAIFDLLKEISGLFIVQSHVIACCFKAT